MPAHKLPDLDPATLDPDRVLSIGQVAKLAPGVAEENHCHRVTIRRWATKGVRVAGRVLRFGVTRTPGASGSCGGATTSRSATSAPGSETTRRPRRS
ncbi:hypothetical protein [Gemmata sp.]|uniref:hypothetical protein n=1 Tax=Gemmata sp. TaxID=1914242 RepID=UPI003F712370